MLDSKQALDLNKIAVLIEKGITVTLTNGDIQIGAVEIKNATTDTRATVTAASTAAQATDTSVIVALNPNTPLPAGTNALGSVSVVATSAAGTSTRVRILTASSTAVAIKASAGNLYGWNIINTSSTNMFVKIYNKAAASVNPASDVPIKTLLVPANGSVYQEPNCIQTYASTALSVRAVQLSADTDTTALATAPILEFEIV